MLRRGQPAAQPPRPTAQGSTSADLRFGRLRLDLDGFRAFWGEDEVTLTVTEFALLRTLAERPGKVFTRDNLMDGAYALDHYVSDRTVDSHIRRVRAKFQAVGGAPVETTHGVGYKLADCQ